MAADEVVQDIYEYVQELSLVKFFGIESRQPLVTDVDGELGSPRHCGWRS